MLHYVETVNWCVFPSDQFMWENLTRCDMQQLSLPGVEPRTLFDIYVFERSGRGEARHECFVCSRRSRRGRGDCNVKVFYKNPVHLPSLHLLFFSMQKFSKSAKCFFAIFFVFFFVQNTIV